jgi:hypothetical protein
MQSKQEEKNPEDFGEVLDDIDDDEPDMCNRKGAENEEGEGEDDFFQEEKAEGQSFMANKPWKG